MGTRARWSLLCSLLLTVGCSTDDSGGTSADEDPSTDDGADGATGDGGTGDGSDTPGGGGGDTGGDGSTDPGDPTDTPVGDDTVPLEDGEPISVAPNQWTWVPVDGTYCRNGQGTGLGININPDSDKLIIYLEGGGACFSSGTCLSNPGSYDSSGFDGVGPGTPTLSRDAPNPFADWSFVYFPYCSGDVFTGTNMSGTNGQPQVGYINVTRYLERLVPTFRGKLSTVVLSGASAGAFGVAWNWMRVQDAFGDVPVHAFDDSAPPMGPDFLSPCLQKNNGEIWGWKDAIHPACTACDVDKGEVVRPMFDTALNRQKTRFALLSNDEDGVIKSFFAYGLNDCADLGAFFPPTYPTGKYPQGLDELRARLSGYPNAALYESQGGSHVLLAGPGAWTNTKVDGVTLLDWVTWFRDGDAKWGNVQF